MQLLLVPASGNIVGGVGPAEGTITLRLTEPEPEMSRSRRGAETQLLLLLLVILSPLLTALGTGEGDGAKKSRAVIYKSTSKLAPSIKCKYLPFALGFDMRLTGVIPRPGNGAGGITPRATEIKE